MARTCEYVPIRITLPEEQLKDTVFEGQDNLKLVVQCRNGSAFEQYLLREYLAYRVLNAITPRSFRARLVSVSYVDRAGTPIGTRHGMLLEDDGDVAKRMEGRIVELPRALFADLDQGTLDTMMMFDQGFAGGSEELPRRFLLVDQTTEGCQTGARGRLLEGADDVIVTRGHRRRPIERLPRWRRRYEMSDDTRARL